MKGVKKKQGSSSVVSSYSNHLKGGSLFHGNHPAIVEMRGSKAFIDFTILIANQKSKDDFNDRYHSLLQAVMKF